MELEAKKWRVETESKIRSLCTSKFLVEPVSQKSLSKRGRITLQKLVEIISDSVFSLIKEISVHYWESFEWLAAVVKDNDDFGSVSSIDTDKVCSDLVSATSELVRVKHIVKDFYANFLNEYIPFYYESMTPANVRHLTYVLHNTTKDVWYLVIVGNFEISQLSNSKFGKLCTSKVWKAMLNVVFTQNFDDSISNEVSNLQLFTKFIEHLHELNLMRFCENMLISLLFQKISLEVKTRCSYNFENGLLSELTEWVSSTCFSWLKSLFLTDTNTTEFVSSDKENTNFENEKWVMKSQQLLIKDFIQITENVHIYSESTLNNWLSRLKYHLMNEFANLKISELFLMIIEYPNTSNVFLDLNYCLKKTNRHADLVKCLKSTFKTRLLHPGAYTRDILTAFVLTCKAMNDLGLSADLLEFVLSDIKSYLYDRHESLHVIMSSFRDESSHLHSELSNVPELSEDTELSDSNLDSDESTEWIPKSTTVKPEDIRADLNNKHYSGDVISNIISIFGDKEVFGSTYSSILCEILLNEYSDSILKIETRNIELLKLRFGESNFHYCEIMLRDMKDSIHFLTRLNEETKQHENVFEVVVISYLFWPEMKLCKAALPKLIEDQRAQYVKEYELLKCSRKLEWYDCSGVVELELMFHPEKSQEPVFIEYKVTPLQAAVICAFEIQSHWTCEQLFAHLADVSEEILKRVIQYWCDLGVLENFEVDQYRVVETPNQENVTDILIDETDNQTDNEDDVMLESIVLSMLKNLGPLPFNHIHSMMQMHLAIEKSAVQMNEFLQTLVKREKIELKGLTYHLRQ